MLILSLLIFAASAQQAKRSWHEHRGQKNSRGRRTSSVAVAEKETHVCSLNSLIGRVGQYAVQARGFFETFETELETLAGIIDMHEQKFLKHGPMKLWHENLDRECSPTCSFEELFWKDVANKTAEQIQEHQTGYWDITDAARSSDLYYPAWSENYAFDWSSAGSRDLPPTPAALGLLKPRESTNLTALCAAEGLIRCKGNTNASCPSYCVWPDSFNNSIIVYESLLTQNMIIPATQMLNMHADSAFIWYWVGADSGAFRPVPPFNVMIGPGVTAGIAVGSDFVCPVTFCGPIMNPSKSVAWTSLITDPYGNLLVTAARPVYIAGKWLGAIMTDILLETTSDLVERFRATQNSHAVLCDRTGAIIGASARTYSFLFCPEHPACNNGSSFSIGQSWEEASASAGSVLGPQLVNAKLEFFSDGGALMVDIAEQANGLKHTSGYYIVWSALRSADLLGGTRVVVIVPEADIDLAADTKVEPQLIFLFKDQTEASVVLKNNGVLPWEWKASSVSDSVRIQPESGVLYTGEITTLALTRRVTNTSLEVIISAHGDYATCIPPIGVYISLNCENGEYRNGSFGSDSCKPCLVGHECLANVLSPCKTGAAQPAMGQAMCQPCAFGRYQNTVGMPDCHACSPGKTAETIGADSCVNCSAGRYTELLGAMTCTTCPRGTYQHDPGSSTCLKCVGDNRITADVGADNANLCICPEGYFEPLGKVACHPCPEGMSCPQASRMVNYGVASNGNSSGDADGFNYAGLESLKFPTLKSSYWSSRDKPLSVFFCRSEVQCKGGTPGYTCNSLRHGLMCAFCEDGSYAKLDGTCSECDASVYILLFLGCVAFLGILGAIYINSIQSPIFMTPAPKDLIVFTASQLITACQVLHVSGSMASKIPLPYSKVKEYVSILFDFKGAFSFECIASGAQEQTYLVNQSLFFAPYVLLLCIHLAHTKCRYWTIFPTIDAHSHVQLINAAGGWAMLCLIPLSSALIAPFHCESHPNGQETLHDYPYVICWNPSSNKQETWLIVASFGLSLLVAFFAMILYAVGKFPQQFLYAQAVMDTRESRKDVKIASQGSTVSGTLSGNRIRETITEACKAWNELSLERRSFGDTSVDISSSSSSSSSSSTRESARRYLHATHFLFFRVRPQKHWFIVVLLGRSVMIALASILPNIIIQSMVTLIALLVSLCLTIYHLPWPIFFSNVIDVGVTLGLVFILFAIAISLEDPDLGSLGLISFWISICLVSVCGLMIAFGSYQVVVSRSRKQSQRFRQKVRQILERDVVDASPKLRELSKQSSFTSFRSKSHDEIIAEEDRILSEQGGISVEYLVSGQFEVLARSKCSLIDPCYYDLKDPFWKGDDALGKFMRCPRDGLLGVALIDFLPRRHRRKCTHFLSWTWGYKVAMMIHALSRWCSQAGIASDSTYLFCCFFCNNQFRILDDCGGQGSKDLEEIFEARLCAIGAVVALLDTWDAPRYLTRVWTIYEQYAAVKHCIPVTFILPQSASTSLVETLATGSEGFMRVVHSLSSIDSERSQAYDERDAIKVKSVIQNGVGFTTVNKAVARSMIEWVGRVMQEHFQGNVDECITRSAENLGDGRRDLQFTEGGELMDSSEEPTAIMHCAADSVEKPRSLWL